MSSVCHKAVTATYQCVLRKWRACPSFSGTTKVSISVHALPIVDTHMLTKILFMMCKMFINNRTS